MTLDNIKARYDVVGNSTQLNHCIEVALQIAKTDLSVLILGESGVGKEVFSKIIHNTSRRKHQPFIAINCGAIPEGTIDSELFGHEKGSFTSAIDSRKGYFETVNGGTIFLDEIGEMPLGTQARLLRVLEVGEFIKVGSSKVQKTNVRIIAATNKNLLSQEQGVKFRQDLFYRLSTVPIRIPPLRERTVDIPILFKKFSNDFSLQYHTDPIAFTPEATDVLKQYPWYGNIRELKNMAEKISALSKRKLIDKSDLLEFIDPSNTNSLVLSDNHKGGNPNSWEDDKEILLKLFIDLKKDVTDLKKIIFDIAKNNNISEETAYSKLKNEMDREEVNPILIEDKDYKSPVSVYTTSKQEHFEESEIIEDSYNLEEREKEIIRKALKKFNYKRRDTAIELGISERTLYRKIKDYNL